MITREGLNDGERAPLLPVSERQARDTENRTQHVSLSGPGKQPLLIVADTFGASAGSEEFENTTEGRAETQQQEDEGAGTSAVIWTVFPVLLAGVVLSNAVSSVVLATNQHIASEFDALSSAAWLLTAYTLAQSASQPLYGKLSDIFGRRACLVFCWTVFGTGCLLSGLGTQYWHVILGRAISGVGSAGKIALTSVVVADIVPLRKVATYRSYVNLMATMARSMGGPIGGWLAGTIGWRWPLIVQFPIAILGLMLVLWKLPEPGPIPSSAGDEKGSAFSRIDFAGSASLVSTIVVGMLALDLATKGCPLYIGILTGLAFLLFLGAFYLVEKRHAKEPILPLDLVGRRDVLSAYLVIALQAAGQFGLLYSIPIYFQVAEQESVSRASTRIIPVVVGNALGTVVAGRLITRSKRYKALMAFANCVGFAGFTLLLLRWHGNASPAEAFYVVLPGVGMGIIQSASFMHLAANVEHHEIAIAGTSWFLAQNVGVLVGASLGTALINAVLRRSLETALIGNPDSTQIIKHITSNVEYIRALPDHLRQLVIQSYVRSLSSSNALSMVFLFFALLVTISIREKPL